MITISIGNVGSGKTISEVARMQQSGVKTYTNIETFNIPNSILLTQEHLITDEIVSLKKDGTPVTTKTLNIEFWKQQEKPFNVVLDEAHEIFNSRRAMTKSNKLMVSWLALIRKIVGEDSVHRSELVLISQLTRRIDVIARDMATQVKYNVCHYTRQCRKCNRSWSENSDIPEIMRPEKCPRCGSRSSRKHSYAIETLYFSSVDMFDTWCIQGKPRRSRMFFLRSFLKDADRFFRRYDTYQIDNLIVDI